MRLRRFGPRGGRVRAVPLPRRQAAHLVAQAAPGGFAPQPQFRVRQRADSAADAYSLVVPRRISLLLYAGETSGHLGLLTILLYQIL